MGTDQFSGRVHDVKGLVRKVEQNKSPWFRRLENLFLYFLKSLNDVNADFKSS